MVVWIVLKNRDIIGVKSNEISAIHLHNSLLKNGDEILIVKKEIKDF